MNADDFRRLALRFPETSEQSHMGHPDFRVGGKIFATLGPKEEWGMAKLTPEQQAAQQVQPEEARLGEGRPQHAEIPLPGQQGEQEQQRPGDAVGDQLEGRHALHLLPVKRKDPPQQEAAGGGQRSADVTVGVWF